MSQLPSRNRLPTLDEMVVRNARTRAGRIDAEAKKSDKPAVVATTAHLVFEDLY
jgi:hypothetical protein